MGVGVAGRGETVGADCDGDSGVVSGAWPTFAGVWLSDFACDPQAASATRVSARATTTGATLDLRLSDIADELIRPS